MVHLLKPLKLFSGRKSKIIPLSSTDDRAKDLFSMEESVLKHYKQLEEREKRVELREESARLKAEKLELQLKEFKQDVDRFTRQIDEIKEFKACVEEFWLEKKQMEDMSKQLDLKEKELANKSAQLRKKEEEYEQRLKELELKDRNLTKSQQKEDDDEVQFLDSEDPGGSVIDSVKKSKKEGEEFRLEDEIDDVADLFIKRFHRQMGIQKLY